MDTTNEPELFLTTEEAAKLLQIKPSTLRSSRSARKWINLQPVEFKGKSGGIKVRYRLSDVQKFAEIMIHGEAIDYDEIQRIAKGIGDDLNNDADRYAWLKKHAISISLVSDEDSLVRVWYNKSGGEKRRAFGKDLDEAIAMANENLRR